VEEPGNHDLARRIGASVREHRTGRGISTRRLAAAAGVSQPFLSNVENGRTMVSVPSLYRIAAALGVAPSELMPSDDQTAIVIRAGQAGADHGEGLAVEPDDVGRTELIRGARARAIEAYHFDLPPGQPEGEWYEHLGEDFVHVLEGRLRVLSGARVFDLGPGDSVWLDGQIPHRWGTDAENEGPTRLLLVTANKTNKIPLR
jgi:transcriptional regulator with XRE-family HTH domain